MLSGMNSREMVAVAIADERVGIDIERIDRDFGRAAERFASSSEISLGEGDGAWLAKLWTAKEAMYKYYGVRGVDLRDELRITAIDAARGELRGELRGKETVEVSFKLYDNIYIVATAVAAK